MTNSAHHKQVEDLTQQIRTLRSQLQELRRTAPPEPVKDYEFQAADGGTVKLSELFGAKRELFVIHNMGRSCPYCTLWADGFNGILHHLENRAAFVVSSPDIPSNQASFAKGRGWKFRMVSIAGTSFGQDMGFVKEKDVLPGVSVFVKGDSGIQRVSYDGFRPGDDYCQLWHMLELLPNGRNEWEPEFQYR
jgi:predicted dithiol-disulfide oxidoreductase (DUF899 family)